MTVDEEAELRKLYEEILEEIKSRGRDADRAKIGRLLEEFKQAYGEDSVQLARTLSVSQQTVSRWINRHRLPQQRHLEALRRLAYGIPKPSSGVQSVLDPYESQVEQEQLELESVTGAVPLKSKFYIERP